MATLVHTLEQLLAAFAAAAAGETILLAPGVYDEAALRDRAFAEPVTIASAEPGRPATFLDGLEVENVENLTVRDVVFTDADYNHGWRPLIQIRGSEDVRVLDSRLAATPAGPEHRALSEMRERAHLEQPVADFVRRHGVFVTRSRDVELAGLDISSVRKAIRINKSEGVRIAGNHIHDYREDGITLGAVRDVVIEDNLIEDVFPRRPPRLPNDHPDMINVSSGGDELGVENVVIRRNVLRTGEGRPTQGIAVSFGKKGNPDLPFENVQIYDNILNLNSRNALQILDIDEVVIRNNAIIPSPRDDDRIVTPRVIVKSRAGPRQYDRLPRNIVVRDNILMRGKAPAPISSRINRHMFGQLGIVVDGNVTLRPADRGGRKTRRSIGFPDAYPHLVARGVEEMDDLTPAAPVTELFPPEAGPTQPLEALTLGRDR